MTRLFPEVEKRRRAALEEAETRALSLFDAIELRNLIRPGREELDIERDIGELALAQFGVEKHWHRRIIRSGPNSVTIASENPPPRCIAEDDIVYVDLGPVFEKWEADIGRSYAFGQDPRKHALISDLPRVFQRVRQHYQENPDVTGANLFTFAQHAAGEAGWIFGGKIAGHIVSEFAHAQLPGIKDFNRIGPANTKPMSDPDGLGQERHWILEIHLVDPSGDFGGFYEQLL